MRLKTANTVDDLNHQQYLLMLKNDIPGMDALDEPIKKAEQDIDNLKIGLGEVMGANVHGPSGNQLTGSGWFGRVMDELSPDGTAAKQADALRAPNMGETPAIGAKPGLHITNGKPLFTANDAKAHVTGLDDDGDKKGVTSSGGGYADFFRGQREGVTDSGGGFADFFRNQREGEKKGVAGQEDGSGARGSWGDEDTGYDYISEQDFDAQLADLEYQLGWREKWTDDYSAKLDNTYELDPDYQTYQDGYNRNLGETTELGKQIEALKEQREWSEKVDEAAKSSYNTEEDAAVAFADPAVTETGNDHLERAAVIIHEQVPAVDQNGNIVIQSKYVLKDTFVGEHDNVVKGILSSYLDSVDDLAQGDTISFVHTHPYCTGHVPNEFSGEKGETAEDIINYIMQGTKDSISDAQKAGKISDPNFWTMGDYINDFVGAIKDGVQNGKYKDLAQYLGDRQVAWLPGVERMYLASPTLGELYAVDKNGPVMDPNDPSKYYVMGRFNSYIPVKWQD